MAHFIATSINLPELDNASITIIKSGEKLYSTCEFQGMHKAYFYWQIELKDSLPILVKGLNRPQIDITPWDGKEYCIRLTVTKKGENRYFEYNSHLGEVVKVQDPEASEIKQELKKLSRKISNDLKISKESHRKQTLAFDMLITSAKNIRESIHDI